MKRMKKAVLLMMVLTMTGCTSAKPKDTSAQPEEQQSFTQPTASAEENSNKTVLLLKQIWENWMNIPNAFRIRDGLSKGRSVWIRRSEWRNRRRLSVQKYAVFHRPNFSHIESCLLINDDDWDHSALLPTALPPEGAFGGGGTAQTQRYYLTDDHSVILRDYTGLCSVLRPSRRLR